MSSDRKQFEAAMGKWDDLRSQGNLSVSEEIGRHAYIYSTLGYESFEDMSVVERNMVGYFENEAHNLAERTIRKLGKETLCLRGLTYQNLSRVLTDRSISDVVVIGNGSFSSVHSDDFSSKGRTINYDWRDVSEMATHLKTGQFVQRTCGNFAYRLGVPFATFAMADHSRLYGTLGTYFSPEFATSTKERFEEEAKIVPIYSGRKLTYKDIKSLYPYTEDKEGDSSAL